MNRPVFSFTDGGYWFHIYANGHLEKVAGQEVHPEMQIVINRLPQFIAQSAEAQSAEIAA